MNHISKKKPNAKPMATINGRDYYRPEDLVCGNCGKEWQEVGLKEPTQCQ